MTNSDERLIEASIHYAIAECGGLARVSTPYQMDRRTKMGVGFDYFDRRYFKFQHRPSLGGKQSPMLSHRMIYYLHYGELPEFIDHIDGNPMNNDVRNLRSCSHSQNMMNVKSRMGSASKYKGVSFIKRDSKWQSTIRIDGSNKYLGLFTDERDAALAYNKAAEEVHGEFANLNVIEGGEE